MKEKLYNMRALITRKLNRFNSKIEYSSNEEILVSLNYSGKSSENITSIIKNGTKFSGVSVLKNVSFWISNEYANHSSAPILAAIYILEEFSKKFSFVNKVFSCVDAIVIEKAENGLIRAFSSPLIPGFMSVNGNCHPVVIAEQIIHEACHSWLNYLFLTGADDELHWASKSGCFSQFTKSPRNIERTTHGIFSYHAVLQFWTFLSKDQKMASDIDLSDINRRLVNLKMDLDRAGRFLRYAAVENVLDSITRNFESLFSQKFIYLEVLLKSDPRQYLVDILKICRSFNFSITETCEVLLAFGGHKTSRIVLNFEKSFEFAERIAPYVCVVNSNFAIVGSPPDMNAYGFIQREGNRTSVLEASQGQVYIYLGSDAQIASGQDIGIIQGDIGNTFGIPSCCRDFFKANWDISVHNSRGDLFMDMLSREIPNAIAWQCNFHATLLGTSLLFHFPCSSSCHETTKLINERFQYLESLSEFLTSQNHNSEIDFFNKMLCDIKTTMHKQFSLESNESGQFCYTTKSKQDIILPIV